MASPDPSEHIPWLDGWRGIAIALVLFEHFAGAPTGRLGVEVFFVLSGLLITKILFVDRISLPTFYRRRAARILPVFYLYVTVMVLTGLIALPAIDWRSVATTAVFLRSYFGSHIWNDPLAFGNLWSLNVEEHAYLLLSLLALLAARSSERMARWFLTAALAIPLATHVYFRVFPEQGDITPFYLRTEGAIFPLLASAAVFLWSRQLRIACSERAVLVTLVLTVLAATVDAVGIERGGTVLRHIILPVLLALSVNMLEFAPVALRSALSTRWLAWLGTCSFSLYLWHYPIFVLTNHDALPFGKLAAFAVAMLLGTMSFYWFERPMRRLLRGSSRSVARPVGTHATSLNQS